jgi:hypothetical protein
VVVVLYAAAFFLLRALIPEQDMAATLAATVLGGGPYVQRSIERRLPRRQGPTITIAGYQRSWLLLFVIGVLAIWAASSAVPWAQLRFGPVTAVSSTIDTFLKILPLAVALVFGIHVGQRCDRYGLAVVIAATGAGFLLAWASTGLVFGLATGTPAPPDMGLPPGLGPPPDPRPQYLGDGFVRFLADSQLPLLATAAMLGFWGGARTRLAGYVGSLLGDVSPDERQAIVELAHEAADARRAAATEPAPRGPA